MYVMQIIVGTETTAVWFMLSLVVPRLNFILLVDWHRWLGGRKDIWPVNTQMQLTAATYLFPYSKNVDIPQIAAVEQRPSEWAAALCAVAKNQFH